MHESLDLRLQEIPQAAFHGLIARIAEIDEFKGWWNGRDLSTPMLDRMRNQTLEISVRASMQMGGMDLVSTEVKKALRGAKSELVDDTAHASGYRELLQAVFESHREMILGEQVILRFHARLLKYSAKDRKQRGKYKSATDQTGLNLRRVESLALRPAAADLTPGEMRALTEWATARLASCEFHPLLVIAGFILEFLAIRPFANGNGRLSRILTNLLLLQCGYTYVRHSSLEKVIAERWTEYYLALRRSQADRNLPKPDITPWLTVFLDVMRAQTGELRVVAEERRNRLLSKNQLAVLNLLERGGELSNRLVRRRLGLPKDTAKQVLNRLLVLNLVHRVGAGRATRYRYIPPSRG